MARPISVPDEIGIHLILMIDGVTVVLLKQYSQSSCHERKTAP